VRHGVHKRFGVALLCEALRGAGVVHVDYRVDKKPERVQVWGPRQSANDTAPPPEADPDAEKRPFQELAAMVLESAGLVAQSVRIGAEPDWLDVYFEPAAAGLPAPGLLGAMTRSPSILAPFHLAKAGAREAHDTIRKALNLWAMQGRAAKAAGRRRPVMPASWLIVNDPLPPVLRSFGLERSPRWPAGVYLGAPALGLRAVVLRELPPTRDTLLVRLLGTGALLEKALAEQAALPPNALERRAARAALLAVVAAQSEPVPIEEASSGSVSRACRKAYLRWARELDP
jgi:hypothetical protein